jgi:hypothetical protein
MKVYVVEYRYYGDDSEFIGIYTSAAVAEKYIQQNIQMCWGKNADIKEFRSRYFISIEDVIGE